MGLPGNKDRLTDTDLTPPTPLTSSDLIVLLNNTWCPPLGYPGPELVLEWQLDDVSVCKQVGQELLDLSTIPRA